MKNSTYKVVSKELAPFTLLDEVSNGKIFFVEFIKKDGSPRRMTARRSVRKGVNGKGMKYRPLAKGMLTVFDMDKGEFRLVNLTKIKRFSANGNKYLAI